MDRSPVKIGMDVLLCILERGGQNKEGRMTTSEDRRDTFKTLFLKGGPSEMDLLLSYFSTMGDRPPIHFDVEYLGESFTIKIIVTALRRTSEHCHEVSGILPSKLNAYRMNHVTDIECNYDAHGRSGPISMSPKILEKLEGGGPIID